MKFDVDRFWNKVDVGNKDDCWNWKASRYNSGYGKFHQTIEVGVYKYFGAHRVSYEIENGEIPEGYVVCHKCDNKLCVNPNHLFTGTQKENLADMDRKGRRVTPSRAGARNSSAKLTEDDVRKIRNTYKPRIYTAKMLAHEYEVSVRLIEKILSKQLWKEVE